MPKIRKYENWFGAQGAKIYVTGQVFYDAKKQDFCIRVENHTAIFSLKDAIVETLKTRKQWPVEISIRAFKGNIYTTDTEMAVYGLTEKEALDNFDSYMRIYAEAMTNRRKMIMYNFKAEMQGSKKPSIHNTFDPGDYNKTEIELVYKIAIESDAGENKAYHHYYEDNDDGTFKTGGIISNYRGHEYKIIPYTQEGEEFFKNINVAFKKLCDILEGYLDVDNIQKAITSGIKLLKE